MKSPTRIYPNTSQERSTLFAAGALGWHAGPLLALLRAGTRLHWGCSRSQGLVHATLPVPTELVDRKGSLWDALVEDGWVEVPGRTKGGALLARSCDDGGRVRPLLDDAHWWFFAAAQGAANRALAVRAPEVFWPAAVDYLLMAMDWAAAFALAALRQASFDQMRLVHNLNLGPAESAARLLCTAPWPARRGLVLRQTPAGPGGARRLVFRDLLSVRIAPWALTGGAMEEPGHWFVGPWRVWAEASRVAPEGAEPAVDPGQSVGQRTYASEGLNEHESWVDLEDYDRGPWIGCDLPEGGA
jgi:hypothetical protein